MSVERGEPGSETGGTREAREVGGMTFGRIRWFLAELVVIVVGVLIALGIDAWYGGVVERRDEAVYLEQLLSDLQETERQMLAADSVGREYAEGNAALLAAFGSAQPPPDGTVVEWIRQTRLVDNPVPIMGTAEALVSTGDLRLFQDARLRTAVTRWLSRSRDYWLVPLYQLEDAHRRAFFDMMEFVDPMSVQPTGVPASDQVVPSLELGRSPFPVDSEGFFRERRVHALLAQLYGLKRSMAGFRAGMRRDAEELRLKVESSLAR